MDRYHPRRHDPPVCDRLFELLDTRPWYSFSVEYIARMMGTDRLGLFRIVSQCTIPINIFYYNGVEYIGLESRRLDYERDKNSNVNMVEDLIEAGFYDQKPASSGSCVLM